MSYAFPAFAVKKSHSSMTSVHLAGHIGVARAACLFCTVEEGSAWRFSWWLPLSL